MASTLSPLPSSSSSPITAAVRGASHLPSSLLPLQNGARTSSKRRQLYHSSSSSPASLSFRPIALKPPPRGSSSRPRIGAVVISYASSNGGSFDDLAARLVESSRRSIESSWRRAVQFVESRDLDEKVRQGLSAANKKLEELGFDARRSAEEFGRKFRASERAKEIMDFASQQATSIDQQFGLVQKFKNVSADFQRNWPMYRRQLNEFQQTSIGQTLLGSCPLCKRPFVGVRSQMVTCNYCRSVVWQPRQDYSKADSDPSIIDVDIE